MISAWAKHFNYLKNKKNNNIMYYNYPSSFLSVCMLIFNKNNLKPTINNIKVKF